MAEYNLGQFKIKSMLSVEVLAAMRRGFAFMGVVAGALYYVILVGMWVGKYFH